MSEMVEKVAAAICIRQQTRTYGRVLTSWRAPEMSRAYIEDRLDDARTAVFAMSEPTEAVMLALENEGWDSAIKEALL